MSTNTTITFGGYASLAASALTNMCNYVSEHVRDPSTMVPLTTAAAAGAATRIVLKTLEARSNAAAATAATAVTTQNNAVFTGIDALGLLHKQVDDADAKYTQDQLATISKFFEDLAPFFTGDDAETLNLIVNPLKEKLGSKDDEVTFDQRLNADQFTILTNHFGKAYKDLLPTTFDTVHVSYPGTIDTTKEFVQRTIAANRPLYARARDGIAPIASGTAASLRMAAASGWTRSVNTVSSLASSVAAKSAPWLPSKTTVLTIAAAGSTYVGTAYAMSMRNNEE